MTCYVSSGTLNPTHSANCVDIRRQWRSIVELDAQCNSCSSRIPLLCLPVNTHSAVGRSSSSSRVWRVLRYTQLLFALRALGLCTDTRPIDSHMKPLCKGPTTSNDVDAHGHWGRCPSRGTFAFTTPQSHSPELSLFWNRALVF